MIVSVVRRETAAVVVVAVLAAGCGAHAETPTVQSNREWVANVHGVLDQLRGDVVAVSGFDTRLALTEAASRPTMTVA